MDLGSACELRTERIKKGLAGSSRRPRHTPIRLKYFAAAACIALAATAAIMFISRSPEHKPPTEPVVSISDLLGTDLQATWAGLLEEPLAGEMKSLACDTESAIRFLVACVDVDPLQNGTLHQVD
ncbi:MAG: hypothetical protein JSW59_02280 [Phycisphaerales bacterium]|nr:MAG: hypothetical protein JSW59_02280 [Phycisphaerales bacterium]